MKDLSVSVVIPSYKRHEEVVRAVESVLSQDEFLLEVIISNDGPDAEKKRILLSLNDSRVRYIEAPRRGNASATRNFGIRHAQGEWVALLDDDDVWLPNKLQDQFNALDRSGNVEAIIAGVEVVYSGKQRSFVRPDRAVPDRLHPAEFLFCGYGGANTSTLMAPRWVFLKYPFDERLERHEDWSWMLDVGKELDLVVAGEEVCERYLCSGSGLSRPGGYLFSKNWYAQNKQKMTSRARAAFVADILSRKAAYDVAPRALIWLFSEIIREKELNYRNLARLLAPWFVPSRVRRAIRWIRAKR